jgi:saccharopine dehydrogenase-like NADP-dependent oxidoreductase
MAIRRSYPTERREYTLKTSEMALLIARETIENARQDTKESHMKQIVIVGAGKIGSMIAELLGGCGDYSVTVVDRSQQQLDRLETAVPIIKVAADITQGDTLQKILAGKFAVLSAAPYHATRLIAEAAKTAGAHYLDLTEDVASTRAVKQLAEGARTAFIPQCGLAPGFITIVASDLASRFDELHDLRMRVGALPKFPSNALNYNLTWSTDGVINEYCEPCEAIVNGKLRETQPLEELEEFSLDGILYEAFNTSGGLGTLCETLAGKVRNLNYRTIRYPGHAAIMKALLNDLRLRDRRELLKDILENAVPITLQDVVIVFVTVSGLRGGQLMQETYANKIYAAPLGGRVRSAIQITTAGGICAVLDMLAQGRLPQSGLIRQEEIKLPAFLANRFGRFYATAAPAAAAA